MRTAKPKGFKIVGHYCYPPVESRKTFRTKEEASKELRKWKRKALENHQRFSGGVRAVSRMKEGEVVS